MAKIAPLVISLLVLNVNPVYAETDSKAGASRQSIIELFELTGTYKLTLQAMGQAMNAFRSGFNDGLPNDKKIPEEVWANLVEEMKTEMDKESFYDMTVPVYQKYLSGEDLNQILAFYRSNTGKRFIEVMPNILRETGLAGQQWGKKAMERILPRIKKRLEEMGYSRESVG